MIKAIQVWPNKTNRPTIAGNGSFLYNEAFKIKFTLFKGPKGLFVGLPSTKSNKMDEKTGKPIYYPDVKCMDDELLTQINTECITKYNEVVGGSLNQGEAPGPTNQASTGVIPF